MRPRLTCGWCVAYIFYFCGQHLRTNPQIDFLKLFASPDLIFNTSHIYSKKSRPRPRPRLHPKTKTKTKTGKNPRKVLSQDSRPRVLEVSNI
uniref:Secreted protein n=1 Tax=Meloidogyne incognita TaxID=6306 RepID=A0A914MT91_MELIC